MPRDLSEMTASAPTASLPQRAMMPVLIALSVNLLGDWLRDALNPRLR